MIAYPVRILMFFSSYTPLMLIFVVLYIRKDNGVAGAAALACVVGSCGICWILSASRRGVASVTRTITECRKPGDAVMGYVAAYLVPFVGFPLGELRENVAFIIFIAVLAYLYVNTDMLHINPMLQGLRYHVYEVTFDGGQTQYLIAKQELFRNDTVKVVLLDRGLWIEGVS